MIHLRPATHDDEITVLNWRNMPEIYEAGFSARPVEAENHKEWFAEQIRLADRALFIIEVRTKKGITDIGVVRYQQVEAEEYFNVSIFMPQKYCGAGFGTKAIKLCVKILKGDYPEAIVKAIIKTGNVASQRAFQKANFVVAHTLPDYIEMVYAK